MKVSNHRSQGACQPAKLPKVLNYMILKYAFWATISALGTVLEQGAVKLCTAYNLGCSAWPLLSGRAANLLAAAGAADDF
jgi:hypothetical protein